jgi:hypothetical protein
MPAPTAPPATIRVAVFRAAHEGSAPGDFAHTIDRELLTLPAVCGTVEGRERCGCGRSFAGVTTAQACTTAVVEERDPDDALTELRGSRSYTAWVADDPDIADGLEDNFLTLSDALPAAGTVVRIRLTPDVFEVYQGAPRRSPARRRR